MRNKKTKEIDPFLEVVNEAILWMAKDLRKKKQELCHTIFSAQELNDAAALGLSKMHTDMLCDYLERLNFIVRTNKMGPKGVYFNVHRKFFTVMHRRAANKRFVKKLNNPAVGFCLVQTQNKTYRLKCAGRECKFFLGSEKECVQGKFFLK